MENNEIKIINLLLDKSKEAFMMSIEIYNKPSIKYRVEGFALFICNAWELMLKAHLIKTNGIDSIYYKDNKNRTISLENCVEKVFTNNKDPLRLNLEKIIELRNTSTHFITEEYEMVYISLFQSCVLNLTEKMQAFHNIDMTEIIPSNFLTLTVNIKELDSTTINAKYPEAIANKLLNSKSIIDEMSKVHNSKFSIDLNVHHFISKDKDKATNIVAVDKNATDKVTIIKELKDPNNTHKYTVKDCLNQINKDLIKNNIKIYFNGQEIEKLNRYHFTNFCKYYDLKSKEKYCYVHKHFTKPQYSYSHSIVDFIVSEIKKDPENILNKINKKIN